MYVCMYASSPTPSASTSTSTTASTAPSSASTVTARGRSVLTRDTSGSLTNRRGSSGCGLVPRRGTRGACDSRRRIGAYTDGRTTGSHRG